MDRRRTVKRKAYVKAWIGIALILFFSLSSITGLILWLAPTGKQSGLIPLFLGFTKSQWGDIHFWISIGLAIVTIVHLVVDRRAVLGYMRYITSVHRSPEVFKAA